MILKLLKSNGKANEYNFCQLYHFKSVEIQEVQETLIGCLWVESLTSKCEQCEKELDSFIKLRDINEQILLVNIYKFYILKIFK
jgi:hypothetical protein